MNLYKEYKDEKGGMGPGEINFVPCHFMSNIHSHKSLLYKNKIY